MLQSQITYWNWSYKKYKVYKAQLHNMNEYGKVKMVVEIFSTCHVCPASLP